MRAKGNDYLGATLHALRAGNQGNVPLGFDPLREAVEIRSVPCWGDEA